ncbi:MAG: aspartate--tRNA ligase [archaeon]
MLRTHTCGELNKTCAGKNVKLTGWVDQIRTFGKIGFLILRDRYGSTQIFMNPVLAAEFGQLRKESVVLVEGKVQARPDKDVRPGPAGDIEVKGEKITILNEADPLPLDNNASEDTRLKYRYLDLRTEKLQYVLKKRHESILFIRNFLSNEGFLEITTPILTKSSPEGARDFLVPSRIHKGKFYALPQAPQQYKQLLMVGGIDKYFQIAPCFRDEDARADRSPGEFYQLDMEMSFIEQKDILNVTEKLFIEMVKKVFPDKKISKIPFPTLTYDECMKKYKTDKPDLRKNKKDPNELAFAWVVDFPLFEPELAAGNYAPMHHMFTSPREEDMKLLDKKNAGKAKSYQHDLVLNGFEVGGGSVRIHNPEIQKKIFDLIGFKDEQKKYFNHMIEAFRYGAPPHGGIAPGIDRLMMVIMGEPSLREIIAFPKNKSAQDVMMDAPSVVDKEQLDELHIKTK